MSARLTQRDLEGKSMTSSVTTSSLHQLIDKSSGETTGTSSSIFSSSLSAGEIPLRKVAAMTARSKYTVVSIRPDGSCSSSVANYRAFKETSRYLASPKTTPTLMESRDELSYHNSSFAHLPPLQTSTPIAKSTTTFGIGRSLPRGYSQYSRDSDGDASSLRVQELSLPSTSPNDDENKSAGGSPQVEELTPEEGKEVFRSCRTFAGFQILNPF